VSSSSEATPRTIAFFPPRLVTGGTQKHLLEVLKFLDRTRFRPIVISAKSGGELVKSDDRGVATALFKPTDVLLTEA